MIMMMLLLMMRMDNNGDELKPNSYILNSQATNFNS